MKYAEFINILLDAAEGIFGVEEVASHGGYQTYPIVVGNETLLVSARKTERKAFILMHLFEDDKKVETTETTWDIKRVVKMTKRDAS